MGCVSPRGLWVGRQLVALARRVFQHKYEYASVRVKLSSSSSLGSSERIDRGDVISLDDKSGSRECAIHVFPFAVDGRIDFVCVGPLLR